MKKIYVKPACREFMLEQHSQLMAGSGGPTAGDQNNPGMGGVGSRRYRSFDDDEDEEEEEDY